MITGFLLHLFFLSFLDNRLSLTTRSLSHRGLSVSAIYKPVAHEEPGTDASQGLASHLSHLSAEPAACRAAAATWEEGEGFKGGRAPPVL